MRDQIQWSVVAVDNNVGNILINRKIGVITYVICEVTYVKLVLLLIMRNTILGITKFKIKQTGIRYTNSLVSTMSNSPTNQYGVDSIKTFNFELSNAVQRLNNYVGT